jgi:hypothetical protein
MVRHVRPPEGRVVITPHVDDAPSYADLVAAAVSALPPMDEPRKARVGLLLRLDDERERAA